MSPTRRLLIPLLLSATALWGQSGKAELFGLVTDAAGLPVAVAQVGIEETSTGVRTSGVTSVRGEYHFFGLPAGTYRIRVEKAGFRGYERTGVQLRVADRTALDVRLEVGGVFETVEVTAAAPLLQTTRGTASLVVDQKKVVNLPLDGRNFVPLIALSPGVSLPPGSTLPRLDGSRPRVSEYLYDGISVLQPEPGQVAYFPIIDAIEQFRVETNSYSAEFGRSNGGVILVSQKSGGNSLHGSLFEFFRNEALNARNLFATTGPKPLFRRNQYGFVLGGPIQKNRTFFFMDWQGTRLGAGTVRTSTVPTVAQRGGLFAAPVYDPAAGRQAAFANDTVPMNRFDPAALAVLDRYPAPTLTATANNYRRVGVDRSTTDQFDLRLDRYFTSRHRVFGRYAYLRDESVPSSPLPDGSGLLTSAVIGDTLTHAGSLALEHSWTLSPVTLHQLRFGYTRRGFGRNQLRTSEPASQVSGIPNIPASAYGDVLPIYNIVGFQQLGPSANSNADFTTSVTQFVDNFSTVRRGPSLKFGTDIRLERLDILQPPSPTGQFQFTNILTSGLSAAGVPLANTGNSFASFLLGQVQGFSIDLQEGFLKPRATVAEFFVQEDWRATSRLTLNAGVRYTLNFPSTEANNRAAVFNLGTEKLDFLGQNGVSRAARHLEKTNFGPRLGLALQLTDSFVLRSGYGLTWIEQAGITTPFTTPLFPFIRTAGQSSLDNINPAFVLSQGPRVDTAPPNPDSGLGQGVFGVQSNQKSGYAQQWNLSLQKTLRQDWSVEAGYLGSKLTRLGVPDANLNQLTVDQLALGAALTQPVANPFYGQIPASSSLGGVTIARQQLLRPYPRFTTVTLYRNNTGNSTYHSFQARVEKRFSAGLTFTVAYTFSRLIDDAGAVFDAAILTGPVATFQAADSFNKRLEKDVSTGDLRHNLASGFVYELPLGRGWQVGGILRVQSGSPFAVTQATNLNAFAGFGIQRPNRVADPNLPADQQTTGRYFNTAAFTPAPQFTIGNSSRNPVLGPPYRAFDLMVGKTFTLSERWKAEFRAEAFNVTNTPPLGNPSGSFGTPAFGTITTAFDPRVFEFVVKLHF